MWELILSNIVTACVIGGGVMMYHYYVEYKKQQYINELTEKARDISVTLMQLGVYMMMMKGTSDINQIMKILGDNKHIKNNIPSCVLDNMPAIFNMYGMSNSSPNYNCPFDTPNYNCPFDTQYMKPTNNNPHFVCKPYKKQSTNGSNNVQKEKHNFNDLSDNDSLDEININISI